MIRFYFILLFLGHALFAGAQEFSFTMYFEDAKGNTDSLILGYDSTGSRLIDTLLGEENIVDVPRNSYLDVRVTNEMENRTPGSQRDPIFHAKKQIVKNRCGGWFTVSAIDIKTSAWPVTATWDTSLFLTECLGGSVFTPIHPGGWWDVGGGSNFEKIIFSEKGKITFTSNISYVEDNDTVSVFYQAFGDSTLPMVGESKVEKWFNLKLFPNPVSNSLYISTIENNLDPETVQILDIHGKQYYPQLQGDHLNVRMLPSGIYLVRIRFTNGNIITEKFIKE